MIAAEQREMAPGVRVAPFLNVLDPGPVNSNRDIVFLFTGDRAGMAADAAVLIDDKSVAHENVFNPSGRILLRERFLLVISTRMSSVNRCCGTLTRKRGDD